MFEFNLQSLNFCDYLWKETKENYFEIFSNYYFAIIIFTFSTAVLSHIISHPKK